MSRKSRRREIKIPPPQEAEPVAERPPRSTVRQSSPRADFTDESQYVHVRGELLRIGVLALCLFSALILLRVLSSFWGLLP